MSDHAPSGQTSSDDFEARRRRLRQERLGGALSALGPDGVAWLALAPMWTHSVATAARFPTGSQSLTDWLDSAERAGLVEQEPQARADPELGRGFWMSDGQRADVLDLLRGTNHLGQAGLRRAAAQAASRVRASHVPVPGALAQWVTVAASVDDPYQNARALDATVSSLTEQARIGEARAAVDAADQLARAVGGPLEGAVRLGTRRLELAYRQASDARHLEHYLRRDQLEAAFVDLLSTSSPTWALHYLGIGGVGKTMLMRRITAQIAKERRLVVSRIDFDHLSPDYPVRRPGELLLALAQELRPHATSGRQEELFNRLADYTVELHEVLSAEPPASHPLFNVTRGEFTRLLDEFCDLVRELPAPVVLLLDTCEELARIPVVNQMLPAVEATFHVLERVHEGVPSVRVIFAGRRPLAKSGLGWRLADLDAETDDPSAGLRRYLPDRAYLMVREIRGFSATEATDYLRGRWGPERHVSEALTDAILTRGREPDVASPIVALDGVVRARDPRYNPFDLSLYAGWVKDDPELTPARILSGDVDPYVDVRIVQRIHEPELRAVLPAIVTLGWIDLDGLRALLGESVAEADVDRLYRALADYEWVEQQRDVQTGVTHLEVEPHLLRRLRAYFANAGRAAGSEAARARLAPALDARVREAHLGDVSFHVVEGALRLLAPAAAARLWVDTLLRVPEETDLNWLRTVTERLMGQDGGGGRRSALSAGLLASAMGIAAHTRGVAKAPAPDEATLSAWPDDETRPWLERATHAMAIARLPVGDDALRQLTALVRDVDGALEALSSVPRPQPSSAVGRRLVEESGALLGAADAHVDACLFRSAGLDPTAVLALAEAFRAWATRLANVMPASGVRFANLLAAKLGIAADDVEHVDALLANATRASDGDEPRRPAWLFWHAPATIDARVVLGAIELARTFGVGPEPPVHRWLIAALGATDTIDGERLASAAEQWLLDREVPEPSELGISEVAERYVVDRQPEAPVHQRTPPLFVTLARKRAAIGDFDGADARLRERGREADATRRDAETVRIATMARVELACRARSVPDDLPAAVAGLGSTLKLYSDARGVYTLRALTGVDLTPGFSPSFHDEFQAWTGGGATLPGFGDDAHMGTPSRLTDVVLDIEETHRLEGGQSLEASGQALGHLANVGELARTMLRLYALDPIPAERLSASVPMAAALGRMLPISVPVAAPPERPQRPRLTAQREHLVEVIDAMATLGPAQNASGEATGTSGTRAMAATRLLAAVGARRMAALAQEEGELLALRLPDAGRRLLAIAEHLSDRRRDDFGYVCAAITASLAAARSVRRAASTGSPTPANARVDEAWNRLHATSRSPGLDGWLARVEAVAAYGAAQGDGYSLARKRVGSPALAFALASPELTFLVERGPVDTTVAAAPAASPRRGVHFAWLSAAIVALGGVTWALYGYWRGHSDVTPTSHDTYWWVPTPGPWLTIRAVFVVVATLWAARPRSRDLSLGLGIIAIGLTLVYAAFGVGLARAGLDMPMWARLGGFAGLVLATLVAAGSYAGVRKWWRSRVARRSEGLVWVSRPERGADAVVRVSLSCSHVRAEPWIPRYEDERPWEITVNLAEARRRAYSETGKAELPSPALGVFLQIDAEIGSLPWAVPIRLDGASWAPWEALLSDAIRRGSPTATDAASLDRVFFFRWEPPVDDSVARHQFPSTTVGLAGHDDTTPWEHHGRLVVQEWRDASVVHAVGAVSRTSAGFGFHVGDGRSPHRPNAQLESPMPPGGGAIDRHTFSRPLRLLLLQLTPGDVTSRLGSDREQASLLREIAADLFEAGHTSIITIPSLSPDLSNAVIDALAERLSPPRRNWARGELAVLVDAVRKARHVIRTWPDFYGGAPANGAVAPDERVEAAWDICLFTRHAAGLARYLHTDEQARRSFTTR